MAEETKPEEKQESPKMNENKLWGILSYISILCLVPLFTKKDNDFVYFHAKQGLVLFIIEIIWYIINRIVSGIFWGSAFTIGFLSIWSVIATLVNLGLLVLSIIGIANVIGDKKKELPLIGKFSAKIKS